MIKAIYTLLILIPILLNLFNFQIYNYTGDLRIPTQKDYEEMKKTGVKQIKVTLNSSETDYINGVITLINNEHLEELNDDKLNKTMNYKNNFKEADIINNKKKSKIELENDLLSSNNITNLFHSNEDYLRILIGNTNTKKNYNKYLRHKDKLIKILNKKVKKLITEYINIKNKIRILSNLDNNTLTKKTIKNTNIKHIRELKLSKLKVLNKIKKLKIILKKIKNQF